MRKTIKLSFLCILIAVIYAMSSVCLAQSVGNDEALLRGKWIFEDITAFEGNVQQAFELDDLCCEIPTEMEIRQDGIDCVWKNGRGIAEYDFVVRGNAMCFSFCTEWKIVDNKLQLTWTYDVEGDTPRVFSMKVTYKLN